MLVVSKTLPTEQKIPSHRQPEGESRDQHKAGAVAASGVNTAQSCLGRWANCNKVGTQQPIRAPAVQPRTSNLQASGSSVNRHHHTSSDRLALRHHQRQGTSAMPRIAICRVKSNGFSRCCPAGSCGRRPSGRRPSLRLRDDSPSSSNERSSPSPWLARASSRRSTPTPTTRRSRPSRTRRWWVEPQTEGQDTGG